MGEEIVLSTQLSTEKIQASGPRDLRSRERQAEGIERAKALGQEDPLEKEVVTHSSILAWRIPWTEEPGRLQSMRSQKSWTQLND